MTPKMWYRPISMGLTSTLPRYAQESYDERVEREHEEDKREEQRHEALQEEYEEKHGQESDNREV